MDVREVVVRLPAKASSCPRADRQTGTGAGDRAAGLEADQSRSNAEIKNEWRCTSITQYGFMLCTGTTYLFLLRNYIAPGRLPCGSAEL
jgi:hypothetical protein